MERANIPLIVGAGPVGLGTALLLQRAGIVTRIIDAAEQPSRYSKALAVNPRTLELLDSAGITKKMLALGLRLRGVRFCFGGSRRAELSFASLKHKYPFMLALSQATTEHLLNEALEAAGGQVERGTALIACRNGNNGVEAELKSLSGPHQTVVCPWLLAADGAHSTARKSLEIKFDGGGFEKPLYLADVPLETALDDDFGHIFFQSDGAFRFLIRVVDETSEPSQGPKLWRVISNLPNPAERIPEATAAGAPIWTSEFHVSHRINERLQLGKIYFAGDAAHIHSPIGARGMNLGLEDAWVFSRLVRSNRMQSYEALRKECDSRVVQQVETLTRMVLTPSPMTRLTRAMLMPWLLRVPFIRAKFLTTVTGLDHSLGLEQPPMETQREPDEHGFAAGRKAREHAH